MAHGQAAPIPLQNCFLFFGHRSIPSSGTMYDPPAISNRLSSVW
jgi:hypothetical protein